MMKPSIAILGGTFDPIHNGHLAIAHTLQDHFHFDTVLFIPCKQSLLKSTPNATVQQRIDMIDLAIQPFKNFQLDLREIQRDTASYTIETLKSLREDYPKNPIAFSMGMDAFNQLDQWHDFEQFLDYAHLMIFPRPPYHFSPSEKLKKTILKAKTDDIHCLLQEKQGYLYFSHIPENPLSSTHLRTLLSKDLRCFPDSLLNTHFPPAITDYIRKKHLYT